MRYYVLACDYDGTLATAGRVSQSTLDALEQLVQSGRKVILVTGREMNDLAQAFPQMGICERVVAENGAVLFHPARQKSKLLASEPSRSFIERLRGRGVEPLIEGRAILATRQPYDAIVLETIREMGLELQVIYNKGAVMVLPTGVNKGTGLAAALEEIGISMHNAVGIGDAENDHALLGICECGIAVANAIPVLRERADLVTQASAGEGVEEIIEKLLRDDLAEANDALARHRIPLGRTEAGQTISLEPYGSNVLIAGPSASGKSTALLGILERIMEKGYQACLIDPEGDYDRAEGPISLGGPSRAPEAAEVMAVLRDPRQSVRVNLVGVSRQERPALFGALLSQIRELRARTGRPHWVVLDEAHHLLPAEGVLPSGIPPELTNTIFTTVNADELAAAAVKSVTVFLAAGRPPQETFERLRRVGFSIPSGVPREAKTGEAVVWRAGDNSAPVLVTLVPATGKVRRHERKYAAGSLTEDQSFYFRGPEGRLNLRAQNLSTFNQLAEGVDDATWMFHLRERAYSRWVRHIIKDEELARDINRVEENFRLSARESRARIIEAIARRYAASA